MKRKPLFWIRSSKRDLKAMPGAVQDIAGGALDDVQWGLTPAEAKPLKGFGGASVQEVVCDHDGNAYRAVYYDTVSESGICAALLPKEIQKRD